MLCTLIRHKLVATKCRQTVLFNSMNSINTPILETSRPLEMRRMEAGIGGTGNEDAGSAGVGSADGDGPSEDWGGLAQQQVSHFHGVVHDITLA